MQGMMENESDAAAERELKLVALAKLAMAEGKITELNEACTEAAKEIVVLTHKLSLPCEHCGK